MILGCQEITKSYGVSEILRNITFHIEEKEKIAIVGMNGAGKSTLLKIIMQEETYDSGFVTIGKDVTIGYLAQHQMYDYKNTIYDEMLAAKRDIIEMEQRIRDIEHEMKLVQGDKLESLLRTYSQLNHEFERRNGYAYKSEIVGILKGLGFREEEFTKEIGHLSGGQKTRIALGRLLLTRPDLIILDEPTNHLDMESLAWLEGYLTTYDGAVLIVSHDRYFLDRIVTKVVEIHNGISTVYHGNYSYYAKKREEIRNQQLKAYYNQQQEIKHQEEVIAKLKSFNREKSIKRAESREKLLNKMEVLEKPVELNDEMRLSLTPAVESGVDVLQATHLSKTYGQHLLFDDVTIDIKRGEHVALVGANGTGKTTILKILNKMISKDNGTVTLGSRVKIGYYDQEHQVLSPQKTIFDEISDAYPQLTNTRIRNVLAAFLFTGDDVFKKIEELSGGERGRVSLAKLMLSSANLLLLDEPTNHLDITSKEVLEQAIASYTGTVLYVSHDRYFINKTATRILDLHEKQLYSIEGNYDYYLQKRELYWNATEDIQSKQTEKETVNKQDWRRGKEEQARERKRLNQIKKLEEQIEHLETQNGELDEELSNPINATDSHKLMELTMKKAELENTLQDLYEQWEKLSIE